MRHPRELFNVTLQWMNFKKVHNVFYIGSETYSACVIVRDIVGQTTLIVCRYHQEIPKNPSSLIQSFENHVNIGKKKRSHWSSDFISCLLFYWRWYWKKLCVLLKESYADADTGGEEARNPNRTAHDDHSCKSRLPVRASFFTRRRYFQKCFYIQIIFIARLTYRHSSTIVRCLK